MYLEGRCLLHHTSSIWPAHFVWSPSSWPWWCQRMKLSSLNQNQSPGKQRCSYRLALPLSCTRWCGRCWSHLEPERETQQFLLDHGAFLKNSWWTHKNWCYGKHLTLTSPERVDKSKVNWSRESVSWQPLVCVVSEQTMKVAHSNRYTQPCLLSICGDPWSEVREGEISIRSSEKLKSREPEY